MTTWNGVIEEHPELRGANKRYAGKDAAGRTKIFWLGEEFDPLPLNTPITVEFKNSEYTGKDGKRNTSSWITNWYAQQLPPQQQAHMNEIAPPPSPIQHLGGPTTPPMHGDTLTPFGYIDMGGKTERTMPTVREQMVKEWLAAAIIAGKCDPRVVEEVANQIKVLERAWDTGQIQSYPDLNAPPASQYNEMNPPPPDYVS